MIEWGSEGEGAPRRVCVGNGGRGVTGRGGHLSIIFNVFFLISLKLQEQAAVFISIKKLYRPRCQTVV